MNWFHFALGIVLTGLQSSIKNPKSLAKEMDILSEIKQAIAVIEQAAAKS